MSAVSVFGKINEIYEILDNLDRHYRNMYFAALDIEDSNEALLSSEYAHTACRKLKQLKNATGLLREDFEQSDILELLVKQDAAELNEITNDLLNADEPQVADIQLELAENTVLEDDFSDLQLKLPQDDVFEIESETIDAVLQSVREQDVSQDLIPLTNSDLEQLLENYEDDTNVPVNIDFQAEDVQAEEVPDEEIHIEEVQAEEIQAEDILTEEAQTEEVQEEIINDINDIAEMPEPEPEIPISEPEIPSLVPEIPVLEPEEPVWTQDESQNVIKDNAEVDTILSVRGDESTDPVTDYFKNMEPELVPDEAPLDLGFSFEAQTDDAFDIKTLFGTDSDANLSSLLETPVTNEDDFSSLFLDTSEDASSDLNSALDALIAETPQIPDAVTESPIEKSTADNYKPSTGNSIEEILKAASSNNMRDIIKSATANNMDEIIKAATVGGRFDAAAEPEPGKKEASFVNEPSFYNGKNPEKIILLEKEYVVKDWSEILIKVCFIMHLHYPPTVAKFDKNPALNTQATQNFSYNENDIIFSKRRLPNGLWIETDRTPSEIVQICRVILEICGYNATDLDIILSE